MRPQTVNPLTLLPLLNPCLLCVFSFSAPAAVAPIDTSATALAPEQLKQLAVESGVIDDDISMEQLQALLLTPAMTPHMLSFDHLLGSGLLSARGGMNPGAGVPGLGSPTGHGRRLRSARGQGPQATAAAAVAGLAMRDNSNQIGAGAGAGTGAGAGAGAGTTKAAGKGAKGAKGAKGTKGAKGAKGRGAQAKAAGHKRGGTGAAAASASSSSSSATASSAAASSSGGAAGAGVGHRTTGNGAPLVPLTPAEGGLDLNPEEIAEFFNIPSPFPRTPAGVQSLSGYTGPLYVHTGRPACLRPHSLHQVPHSPVPSLCVPPEHPHPTACPGDHRVFTTSSSLTFNRGSLRYIATQPMCKPLLCYLLLLRADCCAS